MLSIKSILRPKNVNSCLVTAVLKILFYRITKEVMTNFEKANFHGKGTCQDLSLFQTRHIYYVSVMKSVNGKW